MGDDWRIWEIVNERMGKRFREIRRERAVRSRLGREVFSDLKSLMLTGYLEKKVSSLIYNCRNLIDEPC